MCQASRHSVVSCCRIWSRCLPRQTLTAAFCGATESRTLSPLLTSEGYQFLEGVADNFAKVGNKPCLIILDDLLNEAYSGEVCKLFTKGSHQRNISVILITRILFHQANHFSTISLNEKYILLLKNTRDKNQITYLACRCIRKTAPNYTRLIWGQPKNRRLSLVRLRAGYRRPATVQNPHISRRGSTSILYSLDR